MNERFTSFKNRHYHTTGRIVLFVVAISLITYLLPKTNKFAYEFAKGIPWKHHLLIAPFDFPIYKSTQELKNETDSLRKNFRPYFTKDTTIGKLMEQRLKIAIYQNGDKLKEIYPNLYRRYQDDDTYVDYLKTVLSEEIEKEYKKGIILLPEEYLQAKPTFELMLINGTYAEPFQLAELSQQAQAYQIITQGVLAHFSELSYDKRSEISKFLSTLELNKYIQANIIHDQEKSSLEFNNLQKNIALTSGRVLVGQRIIDKGEIVSETTAKILTSLKTDYESKHAVTNNYYQIITGQLLLVTLLFVTIYLFLMYFRHDVYSQTRSLAFILLIPMMMVGMSAMTKVFPELPFYVIPFAIIPILIRTFFDSRLAFFMHVITVLICAFFASNSFQFALLQIPAGLVAVFSLYKMVRRSHIVRTAFFIFITYSLFYLALSLWNEGDILKINLKVFAIFAINSILVLLVYPLIYIFERIFGFVSDVTLVELSDTNHPVLRRLAEAAPGTFQHSIQVGNLAQEVAYKLGANPALVRAGAMYHDIGKMASPLFFTENQVSSQNVHEGLTLEQSAHVIINHIENGVKMAKKHNIPVQIIDFISTHQGTTKTRFFYNTYINENPDKIPDVSLFSYPGPTPFTKETAILMMADSIEAASRSLKTYSDDEIDRLVEKIINAQIAEDQFINAPITFKEITIAKDVFKNKLKNIYHARIEYPEIEK